MVCATKFGRQFTRRALRFWNGDHNFDPKANRLSEEPLIRRYRDGNSNLRSQFNRICKKAGIKPWGKPFQNCRSTRETELAESFPIHVVCDWIGNSQAVAAKHYLQVTDEHFAAAIGSRAVNALQQPTATGVTSGNKRNEKCEILGDYQNPRGSRSAKAPRTQPIYELLCESAFS